MDLSKLKDKLDGATLTELQTYIDDLTGQRDAARKESSDGRKQLKAKVTELEDANAKIMERLGISSVDDIDSLPDAKGQAEAAKQFEAKLKRAEKALADKDAELSGITGKLKQSRLDALLQKALGAHEFIDAELVTHYAKSRVEWQDDEPFYKTSDDKLVSLDAGLTLIAKTKPQLLKSQGARGSGYADAGRAGGDKNPFAPTTLNLTEQAKIRRDNPQLAAQLQASATHQE